MSFSFSKMNQIMKCKIVRSVLLFTLLSKEGWNVLGFAPQGCSFSNGVAKCHFQQWNPPLQDNDFGPGLVHGLTLEGINGIIPAGAFSGLNGPSSNSDTYIRLYCMSSNTRLSREIFTANLHWVADLKIVYCFLENGLPSSFLENLKSLKQLTISSSGGGIDGPVAHDTFEGLTNLQRLALNAPMQSGSLPSGFFDGLVNLTFIDLQTAGLNSIPPNWFNGLINLETVHISNNNLQTLPQGLFDGLPSLVHVNLYYDPWNCSCELMWILDWSDITVGGICQDPTVVNNVKFEEAFGMLDCTPDLPSTQVTSNTEKQMSSHPSPSQTTDSQKFNSSTSREATSSTGEANNGVSVTTMLISNVGTGIVLLVVATFFH